MKVLTSITYDFRFVGWRDESNQHRFTKRESSKQDNVSWRLSAEIFTTWNDADQYDCSNHRNNHELRVAVSEVLGSLMKNHQTHEAKRDQKLKLTKRKRKRQLVSTIFLDSRRNRWIMFNKIFAIVYFLESVSSSNSNGNQTTWSRRECVKLTDKIE